MAGRLSIRIPDQLQDDLQQLASLIGKSESEIVREAIEEYCARNGSGASCYDLAKQAGWIRRAGNLPKDLSTNKKHMEGFGRD
jgi:predicted DNA-binding protein